MKQKEISQELLDKIAYVNKFTHYKIDNYTIDDINDKVSFEYKPILIGSDNHCLVTCYSGENNKVQIQTPQLHYFKYRVTQNEDGTAVIHEDDDPMNILINVANVLEGVKFLEKDNIFCEIDNTSVIVTIYNKSLNQCAEIMDKLLMLVADICDRSNEFDYNSHWWIPYGIHNTHVAYVEETYYEELYKRLGDIHTYEVDELIETEDGKGLSFAYTSMILDTICECKLENFLFEIKVDITELLGQDKELICTLGKLGELNDYMSRLNMELDINSDIFRQAKVELVGTELRLLTSDNDNLDEVIKLLDKIILNIALLSNTGRTSTIDLDTDTNSIFLYPGVYEKGVNLCCVSIPILDANYCSYYSYKYFDLMEEDSAGCYILRNGIPDIGKDIIPLGTNKLCKLEDTICINKNTVIALKKLGELRFKDKYTMRLTSDRKVEFETVSRQAIIIGTNTEICDTKINIGKIIENTLQFIYGRGKKFKCIGLIRVY